jgi:acetylornithine/succinyldiaminopimelate/putrescine aminotransferase
MSDKENLMNLLHEIRSNTGKRETLGLPDKYIEIFIECDPKLGLAIAEAYTLYRTLRYEYQCSEKELVQWLQEDYLNFYNDDTINPYVALAARGPWIITFNGAVIHDNGGYGMLGLGHAPQNVLDVMSKPLVMANIMTASISQRRFSNRLKKEIGQTRGECPYHKFICINSGSEAVTVAMRIADIYALKQTSIGARHSGKKVRYLVLRGSFHGRTDNPSRISHSSLPKYKAHLHSFQETDELLLVENNNISSLHAVFKRAEKNNLFIVAMFIEPVMGEGNPGVGIESKFWDVARKLCDAYGSLLVADSIQAGLRGTGYLSLVDYPGFQDSSPPDIEIWSKAINAGQYPLSVLGLKKHVADLYVHGVYGNTMTTNPRALEVACAVLDEITPEMRENIRRQGAKFAKCLSDLMLEYPNLITKVSGTGLLLACEINPNKAQVIGFDGLETKLRHNGLGVIHGGKNALRFTPHFAITNMEIELIMEILRDCFEKVILLNIL